MCTVLQPPGVNPIAVKYIISFLLRMRNVANISCRENENVFHVHPPPPKIVPFMRYAEKCGNAEATSDNNTIGRMHFACCTTSYKHTFRICNTYCFSTSTVAAQTPRSVAWYVHCLSCLICGLVLCRLQFCVDFQPCFRQNVFYTFISYLVFRWRPLLYFNLRSWFRLRHVVYSNLRSF